MLEKVSVPDKDKTFCMAKARHLQVGCFSEKRVRMDTFIGHFWTLNSQAVECGSSERKVRCKHNAYLVIESNVTYCFKMCNAQVPVFYYVTGTTSRLPVWEELQQRHTVAAAHNLRQTQGVWNKCFILMMPGTAGSITAGTSKLCERCSIFV